MNTLFMIVTPISGAMVNVKSAAMKAMICGLHTRYIGPRSISIAPVHTAAPTAPDATVGTMGFVLKPPLDIACPSSMQRMMIADDNGMRETNPMILHTNVAFVAVDWEVDDAPHSISAGGELETNPLAVVADLE